MSKWIHIAGIAGKMTSNLALVYKQQGYFVTGSDSNCLPPATDLLDANSIPYVQGHNYKNLTREFWEEHLGLNLSKEISEIPDKALFISTLSKKNKEYLFAKSKGIEIQTIAQAVGELISREESMVSIGTAGKTTTTALLVHILDGLEFNPSYIIGAELADGRQAMNSTDSDWSVMEGDEFYGTKIEEHSKFFEYNPKYILLNRIEWDHADVFPTEEGYIDNFKNLLKSLPEDGLVIANAGDQNIRSIAQHSNCRVKWFNAFDSIEEFIGEDGNKLYWHLETLSVEHGEYVAISDEPDGVKVSFTTNLIGKYNLQNILGVVTILYELFADQIDWESVSNLISTFKGVKKRIEILNPGSQNIVVDDLGGPPLKVMSGVEALRERYLDSKFIVVYEPNSGNRKPEAKDSYSLDVFSQVDHLIIPSLSEFNDSLLSSEQLVAIIKRSGYENVESTSYESIVSRVKELIDTDKKNVIIFFSSYRFNEIAKDLANEFGKNE